jgi:hypothetical protein
MLALRCGFIRAFGRGMLFCCLGLLVCATGCKPEDKVSKYTAPHQPDTEAFDPDPPEAPTTGHRILALIADGNEPEQRWYFKMMGSPDAVGRRVEALKRFATSLKLPKKDTEDPLFDLPAGWKIVPNQRDIVQTTIQTGHSFTPLNLEISSIGGTLLSNINRWREDQLGLKPWTQEELDGVIKKNVEPNDMNVELKLLKTTPEGKKIYWVDFRGKIMPKRKPPFVKQ